MVRRRTEVSNKADSNICVMSPDVRSPQMFGTRRDNRAIRVDQIVISNTINTSPIEAIESPFLVSFTQQRKFYRRSECCGMMNDNTCWNNRVTHGDKHTNGIHPNDNRG